MSRLRICFALLILVLASSSSLLAHRAEPISTEFALPFAPKAGDFKLFYEYLRQRNGGSDQAIPGFELEFGVRPRLQINVGFPILRAREDRGAPAVSGGGKLELGARYLLLGGESRSFALSFQGTVEAPTGSRRLVGDATELSGGIFLDRNLTDRLVFHSNTTWGTTAGGSERPERILEYNNAVVWFATFHWLPVFEVLGRTETTTGRTELALQPEVIYHANPHLEVKVGLPVGLTHATPDIGVRAQVNIIWGGPR